ncbi:MAG: hypothetical protein JWQ48_1212 [Conexibacter sp.]|nr:hypothetical protein [Conexibacter sp.]
MALNIDTSRALRTPGELVAIVEAVRDAPASEPETDSLEWKSVWDITDAAVRFESVRHILGFGNRTVFAAEQNFEGCAYLLAGVEPGNLIGAPVVDPADLDDQLSRYILPGQPRWSPTYVTVDNKQILVFTIEAPRAGDPIFVLQRGYDRAPAGRIFIRRHGKTEEPGPADVRALEARGQAVRPRVALVVTRADDTAVLQTAKFTGEDCEQWLASERERLAIPPEPTVQPHDYLTRFPTTTSFLDRDTRSKDEYIREVEGYLNRAELWWFAQVAAQSVERKLAPMELQIVNPTDRNFMGVEVIVELPEKLMAWMSADDVFDTMKPPGPPKAWGTHRLYDLARLKGPRVILEHDEVERDGTEARRVRFTARHVRPGEIVVLPPMFLTVPLTQVGQEIAVRWRLTSSGVDGWQEGEISFAVADEPVNVTVPSG